MSAPESAAEPSASEKTPYERLQARRSWMVPVVGVLFIMNFGAFVNAQMAREHVTTLLVQELDVRIDVGDDDRCAKGTHHVHIRKYVTPVEGTAGATSTVSRLQVPVVDGHQPTAVDVHIGQPN